ncbi:MAG: bifunctional demethylmenaquinone methyltransferase/2-methoxy-6-polyprenyl-1,4-benzoquinol methylase UbiE [candidate division Zixibacteria bacterium]|nr:bifunctional demethylmenaquinone methyltransferase/2-methoxy-6-polyprenyl-1,4-benzoquinol methylase UbiE [candidate division Zixibacteria bacterium]
MTTDRKANMVQCEGPSRRDAWKMFDRVAHRYDLLNHLLSFGRDRAWRRKLAARLSHRPDQHILDVATGTADVILSLLDNSTRVSYAVGMDMAGGMLARAATKIADRKRRPAAALLRADACRLPFADRTFDAVTIAFGIRNVLDVSTALEEMYRVLKPGGRVLVLEFSLPEKRLVRRMYLLYFRKILPSVGGLISGDDYAYRYLNETVETFPCGRAFCDMLVEAGFANVNAVPQTFGVASIYQGDKPDNNFL